MPLSYAPNSRLIYSRDNEDQESDETPRFRRSPASLQAIFEEAINQHIEEYTANRDRERAQAEGASSSSSSEQQSQAEESRTGTTDVNASVATQGKVKLVFSFELIFQF